MHTTPTHTVTNPHPQSQLRELEAEFQLVKLRVEIKVLETLEALMDDPKPTGDAKKDAIVARERKQAMSQARAKQKSRKGKKR